MRVKGLALVLILFASTVNAEVNPKNKHLPEDPRLNPCTRSNSECVDAVLLAEHGRRIMHKGVSFGDFKDELDSGDNSEYLEEAVRQADKALENGPPISDAINVSIISFGILNEKISRSNNAIVSLTSSMSDYRKMLLLTFKQLVVSYKIENTILQTYYSDSIQEEIINVEK